MAKKIRKTLTKKEEKSKGKIKLEQELVAINSAKIELARIEDEISLQDKKLKANHTFVLEADDRKGELKKELEFLKDSFDAQQWILKEQEQQIGRRKASLKEFNLIINKIEAEIQKAKTNKDSYIESAEVEKERLNVEIKVSEAKAKAAFDKAQDRAKKLLSNNTVKINNQTKAILSLTNDSIGIRNEQVETEKELEVLKGTLEIAKDIRTRELKEAEVSARLDLEEINRKKEEATSILAKILKHIEVADNEKLTATSKLALVKDEINLAMVNLTKIRLDADEQIKIFEKESKEAKEELNAMRTQIFNTVKAKREMKSLYTYIEKIYKQANVPLPKTEINI